MPHDLGRFQTRDGLSREVSKDARQAARFAGRCPPHAAHFVPPRVAEQSAVGAGLPATGADAPLADAPIKVSYSLITTLVPTPM